MLIVNKNLKIYSEEINEQLLFPENKIFRILFDSSLNKMRILSKNREFFEDLRNCFSDINPASFFVKQYGYQVENKVYAINKFGYFESGLIFNILNWIKINFGDLSIVAISKKCLQYIKDFITPLKEYIPKNLKINDFKLYNISDDSGRNDELKLENKNCYKFRDYQEITLRKIFLSGYGRGLIEIPTGGGKSFIIANYIWNIYKRFPDKNLKFLIFVPNKQLVMQFYSDLLDYGFTSEFLTKFTAGLKKNEKFNPNAPIIIANKQFLFKNFKQLPKINCLICDEVHTTTAEVTQNYINKINCTLKLGCTGTIPKNKIKQWNIIGMFSQIIYQKDITELQKKGYISNLKITLLKIKDLSVEKDKNLLFNLNSINKYKPDEFGFSAVAFDDAYNAEIEYFNKYYKELYTPILYKIKNLFGNSLILFDRIEFGTNMYNLATEIFPEKQVFYIDGNVDVKIREEIRKKIETNSNCLIFGQSACVSTGLNFKRLHNIIFFFSGKSFSKVIQSIGRSLRLANDKKCANLIDISFNFKYSHKHLLERLKIYRSSYHKVKPDEIINIEI